MKSLGAQERFLRPQQGSLAYLKQASTTIRSELNALDTSETNRRTVREVGALQDSEEAKEQGGGDSGTDRRAQSKNQNRKVRE
jgi:hypothetical protein